MDTLWKLRSAFGGTVTSVRDHRVLTTQQAATYCGVCRRTMLRWLKSGKIPSSQTPGRRRRILVSDLTRFMRRQGMAVPDDLLTAPGGAFRVVIVDDDVTHTRALSRAIRAVSGDVQIRTAHDGFAGGLLVRDLAPDVLFLDVVMPGVDGLDVCRSIRSQPILDDTIIVMVSGYLDEHNTPKASAAGANMVLPKPVEPAQLQAILNRARHGVKEAS